MPSISIDTFFACSLIVSVALIAVTFTAGNLQTQISNTQDLNKQQYLQAIADHLISGIGSPVNWGKSVENPTSLGFASNSGVPFELDIDKVQRLNSNSNHCLGYLEMLQAAKLTDIAFGASLSQMLSVDVRLSSSEALVNSTLYVFSVQVSQDLKKFTADLRGFVLVDDYLSNVSGVAQLGLCELSVEVPNTVNGSGLFVVFAQASFDARITAFGTCQFVHQTGEATPNEMFLDLDSFNNQLAVESKYPNITTECGYAFTYGYLWNITDTYIGSYAIPECSVSSPIVLAVQGVNGEVSFVEWISYPEVPLEAGADFSRSETNIFMYTVTIQNVLYRLTLRFGDVIR